MQGPLQPNFNSHNVIPDNQNEASSIQPGSSVWQPQGPSLQSIAASQQVTDNLPPHVHQTGQPSFRGNAGFQQASDSLPNTSTFKESTMAPMSNLMSDKPSGQPSSGVWSPHAHQDSGYSTTGAVPSYPVQQCLVPTVHLAALVHLAGSTPNPEEQFKTPAEQESALNYQSQHSVPFGQQEQSSEVNREEENTKWKDDKIELVHLPDPLQSSPSSSSSGQDNFSVNSQEKEAQDEALGRSRSWTDGGSTANTSSDQHQRISQPCAEKVSVERLMSNDFDVEDAQHLHHKCPVEMSYKCISRYFNSGGKNLGKGGFGIVYEGTVVK